MDAKHTPGPWTAERTPASAYWDWTVIAPSGKGRVMQIGIDTDNTEADARLIAAAPDLLEALQAIVARVNGGSSYRMGADVDGLARAAIAKATEAA